MQTLTSIRRREWSGGIASLPLSLSLLFLFFFAKVTVTVAVLSKFKQQILYRKTAHSLFKVV